MQTPLSSTSRILLTLLSVSMILAGQSMRAADAAPVVAKSKVDAPVSVTDSADSWTLDNGIVKATVLKRSGKLTHLAYKGLETLNGRSESWEQLPSGKVTQSLTIDPAKNGGQRAEVAVAGVTGRMDIEVRYTLERGVSGMYTYAIYSHGANYPAAGEGESRFINQMTPDFDWLSVDADRNMPMCSNADLRSGVVIHAKEQRILSTGIYKNSVEHKYSYCAEMYKLPAYGWSSIKNHVGIWFINPSNEYLGGGPTRIDLVCHMGATMLDYWTSGHYAGGAECNVPAGLVWNKVVGPIFVYFNSLQSAEEPSKADLDTLKATEGNPTIPAAWTANANALFQDALDQAKTVKAQWPYAWVQGVDYPQKDGRATVTGKLVLDDPQAASTKLPHLWVGLTHPDFNGPDRAFARRSGNGTLVTWDHDADYYQFWGEGGEDGSSAWPTSAPAITRCMRLPRASWANSPRPTSPSPQAGRSTSVPWIGSPCATESRSGKSAIPTAPEASFSRVTEQTTGSGDGACATPCSSRTTSPTQSAGAITTRTGSSSRSRTARTGRGSTPRRRIPPTSALAGSRRSRRSPTPRLTRPARGATTAAAGRQPGRSNSTWTKPAGPATLRVALAGADGNGGLAVAVNGQRVGTSARYPQTRCGTTPTRACGANTPSRSTPRC